MTIAGLAGLVAFAVLSGSCRDSMSPARGPHIAAALSSAGTGITLDQVNGTMGQGDITPYGNGSHIGKGFDPRNPHVGDAVVATFFWRGSTNTITTVTDHFSDAAATPIGNTYTLVDYVTSGGMSMATYVATNVQCFVDRDSATDRILTVHALFSEPVTDGGIVISSWTGVGAVTAQALGAHSSAFGLDSTVAPASPGPIPIGAGALAFGVTMTNGMVGYTVPQGFADLGEGSDTALQDDGVYAVQANSGTVNPQWTWYFNRPSTWLTTVFALNPASLHLVFRVQPSTTLPLMPITPAVQVMEEDALGNPVTDFNGPVTIAIGHNGGMLVAGTLSGTKTVTAVNGIATFSDLSIDQPGSGYTLKVSAAGATDAESAAFHIGAF